MKKPGSMTGSDLQPGVQRLGLALVFAALAVLVCVARRHFTLSLAHPESFRLMLVHRCGQLLAAAVLWLAVEFALELTRLGAGASWSRLWPRPGAPRVRR